MVKEGALEEEPPNRQDQTGDHNEDVAKEGGLDADAEPHATPEGEAEGEESLGSIRQEEQEEELQNLNPKEGQQKKRNATSKQNSLTSLGRREGGMKGVPS